MLNFEIMKNHENYIINTSGVVKNKITYRTMKTKGHSDKTVYLYANGSPKQFFVNDLIKENFTFEEILNDFVNRQDFN